jgi:hypothetical protein
MQCGTSGGVMIEFAAVEVVNRLQKSAVIQTIRKYGLDYDKIWIFDKIHHEINQFCSKHSLQQVYIDLFDTLDENLSFALQTDSRKWAPGLEIIAARVTKPTIPPAIYRHFEAMEEEKTKLLIATAEQKLVALEGETEKQLSIIRAEMASAVSKIHMEKQMLKEITDQKVNKISDTIYVNHEKSLSDAANYRKQKQAEANKLKLTASFHENLFNQQLKSVPKVFVGSDLSKLQDSLQ